ncbi:glycosyltransferase [Maridesulfovibrio sp.]|uniref:glycosyltransferase n=1 Tax=Maridesulfovibrio sp. TaxID=2795000 RepID=UPI0029F5BB35|nr:glycosyltransferase [Maridesulfovibrio sp.]
MLHTFTLYSNQILSYLLDGLPEEETAPLSTPAAETAAKHLRFADRRNAETIILFGAGDGRLAKELAEKKKGNQILLICDLFPQQIRRLTANGFDSIINQNCAVLTDSSIWSQLLLLIQNGYNAADSHLILNPALTGDSKKKHQNLQKIFSGTKKLTLPESHGHGKISAAAILSPDEPDLKDFINNFPEWVNEIVLVWDTSELNHIRENEEFQNKKIIHICQQLNADFSAQRNRMLQHCSGDWVIYLDADERLDNDSWDILRQATALEACDCWYLPRMTFYPDSSNSRIGYGLWPDLQLRLFKNTSRLRFINRIHEKLTGIQGKSGILPDCPIQHLTHILKSREKIENKLKNFDQAAGGKVSHRLGKEFPNILNEFIDPGKDRKVGPLLLPDINLTC